jgi:hypothetical protein
MLKVLRKRPSYDELINEIDQPFITAYPNRKASEIENSVYMSQLRAGFEEVIEQNNRVLKEKTKDIILQEAASSSSLSHKHLSIQKSSHSPSIVSDYQVIQGDRGIASTISPVLHYKPERDDALLQQILRPDIYMSSSSSSTKRKPEMYNIAGPDMDDEIEQQRQEVIDEHEMQMMHDDAKLHQLLLAVRDDTQNTPIHEIVMHQHDKQGTKRDTNSETEEIKPKRKAKAAPKKASRPNPEADNEPERTNKRQRKPREQKEPIKKEVKKDKVTKIKHDTDFVIKNTFDEWKKTNKGFLFDQIYKRPQIKKTEYNTKTHKEDLINLLLRADGKIPPKY